MNTVDQARRVLMRLPYAVQSVLVAPELIVESLAGWYGEPHRSYHTLSHLEAMAGLWSDLRQAGVVEAWEALELWTAALLFHDAVYKADRSDNEEASAALAVKHARRWLPDVELRPLTRLIKLTALHGGALPKDLTQNEALFLDLDASVLGAEDSVYDLYAAGIRDEYEPHYGAAAYAMGRSTFLKGMLASGSRVFHTLYFQERYEEQARHNMARELAGLQEVASPGGVGSL